MNPLNQLKSLAVDSGAARWLAGREPYEQRIIMALAVLSIICLIWLAVWKPVTDWRALEANRLANAKTTLSWIQANEARARQMAGAGRNQGAPRSLIPIITRSAEVQQLQLTRLQPESAGAVTVVLQSQPFNEMLRWLSQLEQNNGIRVSRIALDADAAPGLVNAQIQLQ